MPPCDGCAAGLHADTLQACPYCPGNAPSYCPRCHVRHMLQAHLEAVARYLAGPVNRDEVERYAWEALRLLVEPYGMVFHRAVTAPRIVPAGFDTTDVKPE